MARRRFFVDSVRNDKAEIQGDEARHLTQVLRVERGQLFEICDNRDVWLAEVELARKEHVVFRTLEPVASEEPPMPVHLLVALIKFDHLELLIEKATELGVATITPVETVRSERGLERAAEKRIARWRRIGVEASQQSRRSRLPEISLPVSFDAALTTTAAARLFLDEEPGGTPMLAAAPASSGAALLVGPEGGWVEQERAAALAAGWTRVTLGPQILRAETAAISAIAILHAVALQKRA